MINWETPSRHVPCACCQSIDTQVLLEFLTFTRHVCRRCGEIFVAAAEARPATPAVTDQEMVFEMARRMASSAGPVSARN